MLSTICHQITATMEENFNPVRLKMVGRKCKRVIGEKFLKIVGKNPSEIVKIELYIKSVGRFSGSFLLVCTFLCVVNVSFGFHFIQKLSMISVQNRLKIY